MTPPLWSHQRDALDFIAGKNAALLAMDMGTGKTRVVVEALSKQLGNGRALVLCPKSVIDVWRNQIDTFWPDHPAVICLNGRGTAKSKADRSRSFTAPYILVLNYELAIQEPMARFLIDEPWHVTVLDESHRIKAPGGRASLLCRSLRLTSKHRLCLTGTPLPHSPLDAYAQFRFLDPRVFGSSFVRFKSQYAIEQKRTLANGRSFRQVSGFRNLDDLHRRMAPLTFRCKAEDVLPDLPDAIHEARAVQLSPKTRKVYDAMRLDLVEQVEAGLVSASNALTKLLRLQQITSGTVRYEDSDSAKHISTEKWDALKDLLDDLPQDEPVVVFCRFATDLDLIGSKIGDSYRELSGRRNELSQWQEGSGRVIGVQIQAGGVGVDLTRARYCVYFSLGFSLGDYEQSLARVRRPGQDRRVFYYHLIASDTVDEKVYGALRQRKNVIENVLKGL